MAEDSELKNKISAELKEALKAREELKLSTLRMLLSEIHNMEIKTGRPATNEDVLSILSTSSKKHAQSIEEFRTGGRGDLVAKEEQELAIIKSYMPAELSQAELAIIVDDAIAGAGAATAADFGKVMKVLSPKIRGRADGKMVSELVKAKLSK